MKRKVLWMGLLLIGTGCKSDKKVECLDVAERVKQWENVSNNDMGLSASVLDTCTEAKWSQSYRKCIITAFGGGDPLSKVNDCEEDEGGKAGARAERAKTSEASQFLKKMSDAARTYYSTPDFSASANSLSPAAIAKQFPSSVGPTPPLGTCCKTGKCDPSEVDWTGESWAALDFAVKDPHYYSYEFKSTENSYEALAYGDLDCDGEYSTYALYGEVIDGEVQTAGDILKVKALE